MDKVENLKFCIFILESENCWLKYKVIFLYGVLRE